MLPPSCHWFATAGCQAVALTKTAPHLAMGRRQLRKSRALVALSGLRCRPRGRLLRLTRRLRRPVLAWLAATLLLRPLLARLRLPALVAVLLLALAHAKFLLPNEFVASRASRRLRVNRIYGRRGCFVRPSARFHPLPQLSHGFALSR